MFFYLKTYILYQTVQLLTNIIKKFFFFLYSKLNTVFQFTIKTDETISGCKTWENHVFTIVILRFVIFNLKKIKVVKNITLLT